MQGNGCPRVEGISAEGGAPKRSPAPLVHWSWSPVPVPCATSTVYCTLLPTLLTGKKSENSLFLHGDPSAQPYKIEDIIAALSVATDMRKTTKLGRFHFNHVRMITSHSAQDMKELASRGEIEAKEKRCFVIHPITKKKP